MKHHAHKLGKRAAVYDARDLQFAHYRTGEFPPHPRTFGHERYFSAGGWGMLGNGPDASVGPGFQGAGDCVFAGAAHETMMWNREAGRIVNFSGKQVIDDYSAVTGYVIGRDDTDNGTDVREALKYRQKTGVVDLAGVRHKIGAYIALEPGNIDHVYEAMWLFGAVGIGFAFPGSAMDQFDAGKAWSVVHGAKNEGGHYVPLVARRRYIDCVTWGRLQGMTVGFYEKYCDEAWAILSEEMLTAGKSLEGFDLGQLQSDLAWLKQKGRPVAAD